MTDIYGKDDISVCRWCGKPITRDLHAWQDNRGFYNCGKFRPHWPVADHETETAT